MRADLLGRLTAQGFDARTAIASTAGVAHAITHYGAPDLQAALIDPRAEADVLANLPVAALRLEDEILELLDRLGLKRIGQLNALKHLGLTSDAVMTIGEQISPVIKETANAF